DEGLEALGNLRLGHPFEAGVGDRGDRGIDAPDDVGTAGGGVLVGRFVQALDGELDGVGPRQVVAVTELYGGAGVPSAGPRGVEVGLFVAPAGHVVLVDASHPPAQVV